MLPNYRQEVKAGERRAPTNWQAEEKYIGTLKAVFLAPKSTTARRGIFLPRFGVSACVDALLRAAILLFA